MEENRNEKIPDQQYRVGLIHTVIRGLDEKQTQTLIFSALGAYYATLIMKGYDTESVKEKSFEYLEHTWKKMSPIMESMNNE